MSHAVLLMIDEQHPLFSLYVSFARQVDSDGKKLLYLSASELEFLAPFVRLRLDSPEEYQGLLLWVPCQLVVMMYEDSSDRKIGFKAGA
jgi:hypothetical protein